MASQSDPSGPSTHLEPGTFSPPKPTDLRSPCPAVNALANHGYLPRDGRNITGNAFKAGMDVYGLGDLLGSLLSYSVMYERRPDGSASPPSWTTLLTNPLQSLLGGFGMRAPGETDPKTGAPVLQLDQLAQHGIVEHDVSLSRRDIAQGDNTTPQPDLIADILSASSDGKVITVSDFAKLRQKRYARQKEDNPKLEFGSKQLLPASAEIALLLKVFGKGDVVPVEYMKAWFQDQRLPIDEGWKRRRWWTVGVAEVFALAGKIKKLIGPEGPS